jgi:regulator of protease activity HflC (stomatin/prohibitin superfamily)
MSSSAEGSGKAKASRSIKWLIGLIIIVGVAVWALTAFSEYLYPYEYGIKQNKWFGGLKPETLPGGRIYFTVPGVIAIHTFPAVTQSLQMSRDRSQASIDFADVRNTQAIEIDTSDGSKVEVDLTVLYHITDAYKVFKAAGAGRAYEDKSLIPKGINVLKKNLGQLLAEDFYHEGKRLEKTEAARVELNGLLANEGLEVDHILIRQYYYEGGYQKQIEERKVKDQLVFTNQSATIAAKEDANRRRIIAEGEAQVEVEKRRGEAEITKIAAEADLYSRKQHAEGNLLVQYAHAQGTELENSAYEGAGSPNLVAERMAEVLEGIDVIVVPAGGPGGINPLDVESVLRAFGSR